ncbi:unnamed protein product [Scytosiphon promiscuus]
MIGIVGRKRSGKGPLATFATENLEDSKVVLFAEPLKQACKHAFNLRDEQLDETRDEIVKRRGMAPRDMMKTLGVDYFHIKDPGLDFQTRNNSSRDVVTSDVRFQNEAPFVRENGATATTS